jgi:hypothetical protein
VRRALAVLLLVLAGCGTAKPPVDRPPEPTTTVGPITAICEDGAVSWAQHRRGACSRHGGVAQWYGDDP